MCVSVCFVWGAEEYICVRGMVCVSERERGRERDEFYVWGQGIKNGMFILLTFLHLYFRM